MAPAHVNLSDSSDLIRWADRRDSQSGLPRLLRRLIITSVPELKQVFFRADEGVALAGWDGITVADSVHPYVPTGPAGWEVSARKDVKTKADEDFASRVANPDHLDPAQSAFVFVTLRRWPGKHEWVSEKSSENRWRLVHAYDADDLETWLEATPSVHLWMSIALGKRSESVLDLDTWWRDWSHVTKPPLTTRLLLAGRGATMRAIHEQLLTATHSFAVRAESAEEALAVFAAAVFELPEAERDAYLARTIVARDRIGLDHFAAAEEPLILVPTFEDPGAIARATRRGHRVVAAAPITFPETGTTVTVSRLSVDEGADALADAGVRKDDARELAILARRSLMAFRRKRAVRPEVQTPLWARPEHASAVLPFLLAGAWNELSEGDMQLVATLAQTEPNRLLETAVRWSHEVDPPVRSVGQVWYVVSKEDSWELLAPSLSRADMERLEAAVLAVLGDRDPRFDLPAETRWMSTQRSAHSGALSEGLAETLAIMGARGSTVPVGGVLIEQWAQVIVRNLLGHANTDWRVWASLSHHLPLIAEAAPAEFLAAVEQGLSGEQSLMRLFEGQSDPLFSSTPHTGLLWALERLAWSPEHLARSSLALAKLERLDPGGKTSNRPRGSLRETFLLWHPQTAAPWTQQLQVLLMLLEREPASGWKVHADILPRFHDHSMNRAQPQWRDWAPQESPSITVGEHLTHIRDVVSQMLTVVGQDGQRWSDVINSCPNLPPEVHDTIVTQLGALDLSNLSNEDRIAVWAALREVVAHHRSFPDADWAMSENRVDTLDELYERFAPADAPTRFGWLFADHVTLPEGRDRDWQEEEKAIAEARRGAIEAIHSQSGAQGIEALIGSVGNAVQLGLALGLSDIGDDHALLKQYLASDDHRHRDFARGFVYGRVSRYGQEWALEKFGLAGLSDPQRAAILVCLPTEAAVWQLAEASAAIDEAYWSNVHPYFKGSAGEIENAARKLIQYGRAFSASQLLAFRLKDADPPSPELIADALEAALGQKEVDGGSGSFSYWVGELLDSLAAAQDFDETRVARIEWAFAPIIRHDRPLTVLHRELARSPEFYVELLSFIYGRENEGRKESSEEEQRRGNTAYQVLDSWKSMPGLSKEGAVDVAALRDWTTRVMALSADQGRPTVGARHVGQVLSHGPHGADGAWPHEAVRDVIEKLENPDVESGFRMGRFNSRGVITRSLTEGGRQERELADQYVTWIAQMRDRWPRTAAILASLEASYRTEARREDDETDLRNDGMW